MIVLISWDIILSHMQQTMERSTGKHFLNTLIALLLLHYCISMSNKRSLPTADNSTAMQDIQNYAIKKTWL